MISTPKTRKPGYRYYEFWDETSSDDPFGSWSYGSECHERLFKIWIPVRLKKENVNAWLDLHMEDDIWIKDDPRPLFETLQPILTR